MDLKQQDKKLYKTYKTLLFNPRTQERVNIEETVSNRLASLPATEFEEVLHSCFEEDEIILILVGAGLGMVAGLIQVLILSGLS